jgi:aspartyl-tRNA(Asn)/glutamyl-tRNA(Gln) amidotransferase subunit C
MSISREEIKHLADLSSLTLSDEEMTSLGADLDNIINYISQLDELKTDGVEPTYQVFEMSNVWRPDEIQQFEADRASLLAISPTTADNQIKVPKVL